MKYFFCAVLGLALMHRFSCAPASAASVQDLVGHYEGSWTNLTFNSTGSAVVDIQLSGASATLVFDFGGFVFGMGDPPLMSVPATVQGNSILINSRSLGIFGDVTGLIDAQNATLELSLTNIPGGFITHVSVSGTFANGKLQSTYSVDFNAPPSTTNPANGVMVLAAPPVFTVSATIKNNSLSLEWAGGKGPYQVQSCGDLANPVWSNVGTQTANTSVLLTPATSGIIFYRVKGQ